MQSSYNYSFAYFVTIELLYFTDGFQHGLLYHIKYAIYTFQCWCT